MKPWYYQNRIKNISYAVCDMFNDISVVRPATSASPANIIKVPITFNPWDKAQMIRTENYTSETPNSKKYYMQFPRMSLGLTSIQYDSERATSVNLTRSFINISATDDLNLIDEFITDIQPVPYTLNYTLYIKTRFIDDLCQIFENILPFFNPVQVLRLKEFSFLNLERDHVITCESVSPEYVDDEQVEETRRQVNGSINFKVESYLYRQITLTQGVIKIINSKFYIGDTTDTSASPLIDDFSTSGFEGVSGSPPLSGFPTSGYNFSGVYDNDTVDEVYYFTSAYDPI
jgi:hypothetical protein